MPQRRCHCRWKQGGNRTQQIRHCHSLCVVCKVLGMSSIFGPILKVTLFQLWVVWKVISRGSTMLWGTWLMQSSSSWLMITSCLTSQFLLFSWHLGWHEIGLMPGVSGEYAWKGGVVQSPCNNILQFGCGLFCWAKWQLLNSYYEIQWETCVISSGKVESKPAEFGQVLTMHHIGLVRASQLARL